MGSLAVDLEIPSSEKHVNNEWIWVDGCYDMGHFGHANSFRQAKAMGTRLIVGVHSDEEITKHKGPPVFLEEERYAAIRGMKWVDEVVPAAPYVTTVATLDKYGCRYCGHADDITTTCDGKDTYQAVKDAKRYKEFKRTQGVSTTDLINRMLSMDPQTTGNKNELNPEILTENQNVPKPEVQTSKSVYSPWTGKDPLLLSTRLICEFAKDLPSIPEKGAKVVYVAGAFDVLHPGHLGFLEATSKLGDFLIVGLHDDPVVNMYKGSKYPVMKMSERYLSLLGCKYVSDVVLGAPYVISEELIKHFKVTAVARGKRFNEEREVDDPYAYPKKNGLYHEVDSGSSLTTSIIVERVLANRKLYEERNRAKEEREIQHIESTK